MTSFEVVEQIASQGLINTHWLVTLDNGERAVLRRYGWPWPGAEPFDRCAKEAWLLPLLERAGVPAPRLIAVTDEGLLLRYVDGVMFAERPVRTPAMWRNVGAALRAVHDADIGVGAAEAGMLVAGGVDAFDGGWATWHVNNTRDHAQRLASSRPELRVDVERCVAIVESARPLLDARPLAVIHTDANPWNVLVDDDGNATWMDWEFAWFGDPLYDFVRMRWARKHDIGPVPSEFYDGYGGDPTTDVVFDVYTLGFMLWMANEAQAPLLPAQTTYEIAEVYLGGLAGHLDWLAERVDDAVGDAR